MHSADELHKLRVQSVNPGLVRGLLADLEDLSVDFLPGLVDDFLDPARMDPAVRYELLEREPRDLAPDRIEAGHHDCVRRVVDDDVDSSRELECSNVPAFPANDTPLHL